MAELYTTNGKEVLLGGVHFADGCSAEAAEIIVKALRGELAKATILKRITLSELDGYAKKSEGKPE